MEDRHVVLGVTGSIAAYKAVDLASKLTQAGVAVDTVMTASAGKLVAPASFRAITGRPVSTDLFELSNPFSIEHVSLAERADLLLIAPATANLLAKLANGIADDLLTCTALATRTPILIAPAMHTAMWTHPATRANVETLRGRGIEFVGPCEGRLASGGQGVGRFAPVPEIVGEALRLLGRTGELAGCRMVVSAGGTREPLDPVRFLGNRSSGRIGFALAEAARNRGADVTVVHGSVSVPRPSGVSLVAVETAEQMRIAIEDACREADVLIMAAAVADYAPTAPSPSKLKKTTSQRTIELSPIPDILAALSAPRLRVGFAAETEDLVENARSKLEAKRLDLVVANRIGPEETPFDADRHRATLVDATTAVELPPLPKRVLAERILDRIAQLLDER